MASTSRSKGGKRQRRVKQPKTNWLELPTDVTANIIHRVGAIDIIENVQKVCTSWRSICKDPAMWRVIDMANHGGLDDMPYDLEKMCRHAVDRSQGQLVDITIKYFGTIELLRYIADRSNQLRRLCLVSCYGITSDGLVQVVKKLPLLEEFQLFKISITAKDIEVVGNSCPLLKSFKLDYGGPRSSVECNEAALAIATSMPGLRHLRLFANNMTNDGLMVLYINCSQLESLDLRQCFNVDLGGSLGKIFSEEIKDLRQPHDSLEDYEFYAEIRYSNSFYDDYPYIDSPEIFDGYISA